MAALIDRDDVVSGRNYSAGSAAGRPRLIRSFGAGDSPIFDRTGECKILQTANRGGFRLFATGEFFDHRKKLAQHDRFRDIAVAAAVEGPAFVTRHCKGRDRDHRNR